MDENKKEKFNLKKNLKWIIPVAAIFIAGLAALGFMFGGDTFAGSGVLSEEAQNLYTALAADGTAVIELSSEIKVSPILYVNGDKTLTGGSIVSNGGGEYIIVINDGARLTLDGTVIDGTDNSPNGIYVSPAAEYAMKSGSVANVTGHLVRVLGKSMISGGKLENAGTNWIMLDDVGTLALTGGELTNSGESGIITAAGSKSSIEAANLSVSGGNIIYNLGSMELKGGSYAGAGDYAIYNAGNLIITDTDLKGARALGYIDNDSAGKVEIIRGSMSDSSVDFVFNKGTMSVTKTKFESCSSTAIENRCESAVLNLTDVSFDDIGKNVLLNKLGTVNAKNVKIGECGGMAVHNRGADFFGSNVTVEKSGGIAFLQDFAADGDTAGAKTFELEGFEVGFADDYGIRINGGDVVLSKGTVGKCTSYGLYVKNGNVTTNSCTFLGTTDTSRNTVQIGLNGSRDAVVVMNNTNITGGARGITNHATLTFNSGRIYENNSYGETKVGAGISSDGTLYINGGIIENNHSISTGAGIYNTGECTIASGTVIRKNKSDASGGGIGGKNGKLIITGGSIYGNTAVNYGGGLYCSGDLTIKGGTIYSNYAWQGGGGIFISGTAMLTGGTVRGNSSNGAGGGIYTGGDGETVISGTLIENNASDEKGGGGVYNLGWTRIETTTKIQNNKCATNGGGVSNSKSSTDEDKVGFMIIDGGTITGNTSTGYFVKKTDPLTGEEYTEKANKGNGGGVSNTGYMVFENGLVSGNTSEDYGGGIYNSKNLFLKGGEISKNAGKGNGGGVGNAGYMEFENGLVSENTSEGYGGGVYNSKNLFLKGGEISKNTGKKGGGGLENTGCAEISGGAISGNTAGDSTNPAYGGGIYNGSDANMVLSGGTVSENIAFNGGGGVYNSGGSTKEQTGPGHIQMTGGTITENTAGTYTENNTSGKLVTKDANGAGVYSSGYFTMTGGSVEGNVTGQSKDGNGKAHDVYIYKGETLLSDSASVGSIYRATTGTLSVGANLTKNGQIYLFLKEYIEGIQAVNGTKELIIANRDKFTFPENKIGNLVICDDGKLASRDGLVENLTTGSYNNFEDSISAAQNGDILQFLGNIDLSSAVLIEKELEIDGKGNALTYTSADAGMTNINNLTIKNLTIGATKDVTLNNQALNNNLNLALNNVVISGIKSVKNGAAIYNAGTLNMTGGSISGCTSGGDQGGGALFNKKDATLSGVSISSCTATNNGGGIYTNSTGTTTLKENCTISGCTASSGGGIYNGGTVEVNGSSISGCQATAGHGGGINNVNNGTLTIVNSTINNNKKSSGKYGPDIYTANSNTIFSGEVTIGEMQLTTGNTLQLNGPVTGGTIRINVGGAEANREVVIGQYVAESVKFFKIANKNPYYQLNANGRLEQITDPVMLLTSDDEWIPGTLEEMANLAVEGNTLKLLAPVSTKNDVTINSGVKLDLNGNTLTISSGNKTTFDGVEIISSQKFTDAPIINNGELELVNGCTITGLESSNNGGVNNSGTFTMTGGSISGCTSGGSEGGGALFNNASAKLDGVSISSCSATKNAGAVYTSSYGNTQLLNCSIQGCNATGGNGGAVYNGGIFTMTGGSISGCSSDGSQGGGALFNKKDATLSGVSISSCTATNNGGGIYTNSTGTTTLIENCTISGCTASSGGGVYNGGSFTMSDGSITSCGAANYGGGLYKKKGSTINVMEETITGNTAGKGTNQDIYTQR